MKHVAAAALLFLAATGTARFALAHPDEQRDAPQTIDCRTPSEDVITRLPAPLDRWAQLHCTPEAQFLVPSRDWLWRYPASFTTPVLIPAWTPNPSRAAAQAHYFISVEIDRASDEDAHALDERMAREISIYGALAQSPVSEVYTLRAENNHGEHFDIHFMYRSDQDVWGLVCAPRCGAEMSFRLNARTY
ncbi:MAG: hypothetical protein IT532_01555 [Burkholderiales bacterium]|nr:hypothetical protein [Burkholderiales bacterium]